MKRLSVMSIAILLGTFVLLCVGQEPRGQGTFDEVRREVRELRKAVTDLTARVQALERAATAQNKPRIVPLTEPATAPAPVPR